MRMKLSIVAALVVAVTAFASLAGTATAAKSGGGGGGASLTQPVSGTFTDATGGLGTFTGSYTLKSFTTQGGQLAAVGTLTGTLTDSLGTVIGTVTQTVTMPATASGSCQILHLDLGPLDLNLLGLQVHLNEVVLDITAQSGPGNLLGNLLCGVANLLNSGATSSQIANILNQILAILR
jgi:hypothetical protein